MTVLDEHPRRTSGIGRSIGAAALLMLLAGCPGGGGNGDGNAGTGQGPGTEIPPATFAPSVSTAEGQTCTNGWRAHGHTNQPQAQAFLRQCLADQGVVGRRMTRDSVLATAATVIPASSPLTSLVPGDIAAFCPGYAGLSADGRADFWRALVTAIARPESDFRTDASLWELGNLNQFSIGLLQLSFTDRASGCDFNNEADLADPARNLACGARILNRLVSNDGVIGGGSAENRGGARYWSTLRSDSPARAEVIGATSNLAACGAG